MIKKEQRPKESRNLSKKDEITLKALISGPNIINLLI
jgi:hypothetical protein